MPDTSLTITANAPPPAPTTATPASGHGFFDNLLSELNPLQYVPVVGIIYRAVTGDTISDEAKFAGSLVVSGLTGGPVGIGLNVGAAMLEHMLGVDPEKIGDQILARLRACGSQGNGRRGRDPAAARLRGRCGRSGRGGEPSRRDGGQWRRLVVGATGSIRRAAGPPGRAGPG